MPEWTIQKLLKWVTDYFNEKKIDSPRLSAELLLSYVLQLKRIDLYTQFDKPVPKEKLDVLHELVKRASKNEPVNYITGKTEFFSIEFEISPDCLITRPETELLVESAVEFLRSRSAKKLVCDLCTGCGCIAVAIAKNVPSVDIIATDISDAALKTAAKNIEKHNLKNRIKLLCGDLFDPIIAQLDIAKFDLIVCNPPYVSSSEYQALGRNVKDYEPKIALYAGDDGLDTYRRITEKVCDFLNPDAALILEIGYSQGPAVRELLGKAGCFGEIKIEKDYQNNDRIVTATKVS